jgi:hypothetical protein
VRRWLTLAALGGAAWGLSTTAQASLRWCEPLTTLSAPQQDQMLRFTAAVKAQLAQSGQPAALVSRSGLDLSRIGLRYSHAGISLQHSPSNPWAVRQLYYACDEQQPRLYDQGLTGFLLGSNDPALGYISVISLPDAAAQTLAQTALDKARALQLLHPAYSANAYAFSTVYQNCNQWVAELLASAWGPSLDPQRPRAAAQTWLQQAGYQPSVIDVGWGPLRWFGSLVPWLHSDDHPAEALARGLYQVSMPASLEAFVRQQVPGATRTEFCHTAQQMVIHQGWEPVAEGCVPGEGDLVMSLD